MYNVGEREGNTGEEGKERKKINVSDDSTLFSELGLRLDSSQCPLSSVSSVCFL